MHALSIRQIPHSTLADTAGSAYELRVIENKLGALGSTIRDQLVPIEVQYYSFSDNTFNVVDTTQLYSGILIVHRCLVEDVKAIFATLQLKRFPIAKVIPVNCYGLNADSTGWNDEPALDRLVDARAAVATLDALGGLLQGTIVTVKDSSECRTKMVWWQAQRIGAAGPAGAPSLPDYRAMALGAKTDAEFDYAAYMTLKNGMYTDQERIRRNLTSRFGQHTMWAGVACYPAHAFSTDELLDQASLALESAREWKQDRIEVATAD